MYKRRQRSSPVFAQDLPDLTMDGWEVTASHVDYPDTAACAHRHPVLRGLRVQGSVVAKVFEGEERTFAAADVYETPAACTKCRDASATQPAKTARVDSRRKAFRRPRRSRNLEQAHRRSLAYDSQARPPTMLKGRGARTTRSFNSIPNQRVGNSNGSTLERFGGLHDVCLHETSPMQFE